MKPKQILSILFLIVCIFGCKSFSKLANSGTLLVVEVEKVEANQDQTTDQAVDVLQNRLDAFGANGDVEKTSANTIEVKIYGDPDIERIKRFLISESRLELYKIATPPSPSPLQTFPTENEARQSLGGTVPSNRKILTYTDPYSALYDPQNQPKEFVVVENPPIVDGRDLRDASAFSRTGVETNYQIAFSFTPAGAQKFGDWTGKNINNYLAVALNNEIKSAPYVRSQISDSGEISGRFTKEQAQDLALILKSGYFPTKLTFVEEKPFGK